MQIRSDHYLKSRPGVLWSTRNIIEYIDSQPAVPGQKLALGCLSSEGGWLFHASFLLYTLDARRSERPRSCLFSIRQRTGGSGRQTAISQVLRRERTTSTSTVRVRVRELSSLLGLRYHARHPRQSRPFRVSKGRGMEGPCGASAVDLYVHLIIDQGWAKRTTLMSFDKADFISISLNLA